jgi:hypothetical protein
VQVVLPDPLRGGLTPPSQERELAITDLIRNLATSSRKVAVVVLDGEEHNYRVDLVVDQLVVPCQRLREALAAPRQTN